MGGSLELCFPYENERVGNKGGVMFRPFLDFKEDGRDYRKTGYLPLIEDATALLRAINEWLAELARKEAVRLSEKEGE